MLPIHFKLYTPPSSPPSPCSTWVNSSSPPSSPVIEPLSLDGAHEDERELPRQTRSNGVTDPLAGSYNTNRLAYTTSSPQKRPRLEVQMSIPELDSAETPKVESANRREEALWEKAIDEAFETGDRKIDLMSENLTEIPPRIIQDLSKMVVLPVTRDDIRTNWPSAKSTFLATKGRRAFTRIQTAPTFATTTGWPALSSQGKTLSSNSILGTSFEAITLFLANNDIKKLPSELWSLHNLTVLSLRNNSISYLPPEIEQLENLVELNVARNKLQYIPAELMGLKRLETLILFPNPFKEPPPLKSVVRSVSDTQYTGSRVPPLSELTLRVLLSRPTDSLSWPSTRPRKTILEEFYSLPLPTGNLYRPIPIALRRTLATCVPGSITVDVASLEVSDSDEPKNVTGVGRCPNPGHGNQRPVFVRHAEERYSWEKKIGRVDLGQEAAVRWRGCQRGCLDFLGPPKEADLVGESPATEDDEDVELDDGEIVQTVQFEGRIPLDFDD